MPKSRVRKKAVYTPPPKTTKVKVSPRWLVPAMLAFLLVGLLWIAIYYVTAASGVSLQPFSTLQDWNLAIGFACIIVGVVLSTRWR